MKIYEYKNYEEYLDNQIEANVKKLKNIYVEKKTIRKICEDKTVAGKILCHGTRNAAEQFYFKESFPDAEIIGTEVSHTASKFPMTVQHDFNNVREDWVGYFDVVYSNAFDHCFDPISTIKVWADQMSPVEIYDDELRQLFNNTGLQLESTFESTGLKGKVPCRVYVLTK